MPDQRFTILVTAKDAASKVFAAVKKSVGTIAKPLGAVKSAAGAVTKEASRLTTSLAAVATPLAAITGAASVAGVAALATEWARLGQQVALSAAVIGISTTSLQAMQGAATLTGASAESLTGGLKSLGDTMEDAIYGRNQGALMMMSQLGLRMHKTADGAVDTERAMGDLGEAISKIKSPQVQGLVAREFGVEALLPYLRKGRAGMQAYAAEAQRLGAVMSGPQVAAAQQFQENLSGLGLAVEGVKNSIGSALMPVLGPLITATKEWFAANRELIGAKVGEFVSEISDDTKKIDWHGVIEDAKSLWRSFRHGVEAIGGWKWAALALVAVIEGPLIASFLSLGTSLVRLGALVLTNPVGFTLTMLAIAGYELYEHWSEIPAIFKDVGVGIAGAAVTVFGLSTALPALASGFRIVTTAIRVAEMAMISNPIGLIAAAIAIAGYEIYQNWDTIGPFFKKMWAAVTDAFDAAWAYIKPIVDKVIGAVQTVTSLMPGLSTSGTEGAEAPDMGGNAPGVPTKSAPGAVAALIAADQGRTGATAGAQGDNSHPAAPASDDAAAAAAPGAAGEVEVHVYLHGATPQTRVVTQAKGNVTASARVDYSMPTVVAP